MNFDEWREIYSAGPLMNEAMARAAWDAAIAAEREACAQVCDDTQQHCSTLAARSMLMEAAVAIRARSKA